MSELKDNSRELIICDLKNLKIEWIMNCNLGEIFKARKLHKITNHIKFMRLEGSLNSILVVCPEYFAL